MEKLMQHATGRPLARKACLLRATPRDAPRPPTQCCRPNNREGSIGSPGSIARAATLTGGREGHERWPLLAGLVVCSHVEIFLSIYRRDLKHTCRPARMSGLRRGPPRLHVRRGDARPTPPAVSMRQSCSRADLRSARARSRRGSTLRSRAHRRDVALTSPCRGFSKSTPPARPVVGRAHVRLYRANRSRRSAPCVRPAARGRRPILSI